MTGDRNLVRAAEEAQRAIDALAAVSAGGEPADRIGVLRDDAEYKLKALGLDESAVAARLRTAEDAMARRRRAQALGDDLLQEALDAARPAERAAVATQLLETVLQASVQLVAAELDPEARLTLAEQIGATATELADLADDTRRTAAAVLITTKEKMQKDVADTLKVSAPWVGRMVNEQVDQVVLEVREPGGPTHLPGPRPLDTEERQLLCGLILRLMATDLERDRVDAKRARKVSLRRAYAKLVTEQFAGQRTGGLGTTALADSEASLAAALKKVPDPEVAILLLVELAAAQPWASLNDAVPAAVRTKTMRWAQAQMTPVVSETDVDRIQSSIAELASIITPAVASQVGSSKRRRAKWAIVLGASAVGAAVTGGLAAPLIGTAIGTAAGLSGAAATAAGLAFLGGGSLAAGGMGMAGGTMLLGTVGGLAGAGDESLAAKNLSAAIPKTVVDSEAIKLGAVIRALIERSDTKDLARAYIAALEKRIASSGQEGRGTGDATHPLEKILAFVTAGGDGVGM